MTDNKNIIINELLTFVQNKINVLDELSIIQICATNFADSEIENGKQLVYTSLADGVRCPMRKGDDKNKKNLKDIIKVLKESDPDNHPVFVARDLNRLPPVSFDHVDVSRLLKDLTYLKNEVNQIRSDTVSKCEISTLEKTFRTELGQLRACLRDTKQNKRSELPNERHTHNNNAPTSIASRTSDAGIITISEKSTPREEPSPSAAPAPALAPAQSAYVPTYRDMALHVNSVSMQGNTARIDTERTGGDGFTLVERSKPKHKKPKPNMRGSLTSNGPIQVAESLCSIYVSRAKTVVTEKDIKDHILEMGEECISVEKLKQNHATSFNSFKIVVTASRLTKFLDSSFWPSGLVYRRYRERPVSYTPYKTLNG